MPSTRSPRGQPNQMRVPRRARLPKVTCGAGDGLSSPRYPHNMSSPGTRVTGWPRYLPDSGGGLGGVDAAGAAADLGLQRERVTGIEPAFQLGKLPEGVQ